MLCFTLISIVGTMSSNTVTKCRSIVRPHSKVPLLLQPSLLSNLTHETSLCIPFYKTRKTYSSNPKHSWDKQTFKSRFVMGIREKRSTCYIFNANTHRHTQTNQFTNYTTYYLLPNNKIMMLCKY